jgi:hypothetical protein
MDPLNSPLVVHGRVQIWWCGNWQEEKEAFGEKPDSVQLFPPRIPHEISRDSTRDYAVQIRRLTD